MPKLPSWATTALSLLAGVLAVLNQTAFHFGSHWYAAVTIGLTFLAGIGISPLLGTAFRNALHLPHGISVVISSAISSVTLAVSLVDMSHGLKAVLVGALTFLAGVGFGPDSRSGVGA